jgi:NADH dehydrogenase (ubiquinone) Fe-S protein 6
MIEPPETTLTDSPRVRCDGAQDIRGGVALGHPRVWLEIGEEGFVDCGYCDRRFVLRGGAAERSNHELEPGSLFPEDNPLL